MTLFFTGADHLDWLQGQVTNDVRHLPCHFGLCHPNGTLAGLGEMHAVEGGVQVSGNEASMSALEERVRTHVIMEDLEVMRIDSTPDPELGGLDSLERGIPIFGVDTGPKTLLPELGERIEATHMSYAKGCYVGQEILHRLHARGETKTVWSGLVCDELIAVGHYEGVWVTRSGVSPRFGPIAAGYVRRGVTDMMIHARRVRVVPMPFTSSP